MIDLALCIGTNYPGTSYQLSGCRNDAEDWAAEFAGRGARVITLLDEEASRAAIVAAMTDLTKSLRYGQTLVVTYSGHGTYLRDTSGDERDLRDEAWCPNDMQPAGLILDDQLDKIARLRIRGSRIVILSDSCHSGTVNRLAGPLIEAEEGDRPVRKVRFLPPERAGEYDPGMLPPEDLRFAPARYLTAASSALLISGCHDTEYSYDAWFRDPSGNWRANGAFTWVALRTLRELPEGATYLDWHRAMVPGRLPAEDYPQTPQLTGTYDQKRWKAL